MLYYVLLALINVLLWHYVLLHRLVLHHTGGHKILYNVSWLFLFNIIMIFAAFIWFMLDCYYFFSQNRLLNLRQRGRILTESFSVDFCCKMHRLSAEFSSYRAMGTVFDVFLWNAASSCIADLYCWIDKLTIHFESHNSLIPNPIHVQDFLSQSVTFLMWF